MDSLIGKIVDVYRIDEVIGRGGMGVVFKAFHTRLQKYVALKMIDPFMARDENFLRRFHTEAIALAKLENPNIVNVYDIRDTEYGSFIVMEYVESQPLSKSIELKYPFSILDTLSITKQLLNAIGHAHKAGVIHRDIKPNNILLTCNKIIKVTDFGLAKVVDQKGHPSIVSKVRAGTLYYMSPEQVQGLINVDTRSDIYSLGMTIYEMITGRVPFNKTDSDFTIQKIIVDGEICSPLDFNNSIPQKFAKIILKAINKDPQKRYQTAKEMLEDIEVFEKEMNKCEKTVVTSIKEKPKVVKQRSKMESNNVFIRPVIWITLLVAITTVGLLFFIFKFSGEPPQNLNGENANPRDSTNRISKKVDQLNLNEQKINIQELSTINPTKDNFGLITILTEPSKASVYLNNRLIGSTPIENYKDSMGTYRLLIKKDGYIDINRSIIFDAAKPNRKSFILTKETDNKPEENINPKTEVSKGKIEILVRPWGDIYINDDKKIAGTSALYKTELPMGKNKIKVEHAGLGTYEIEIDILAEDNKTYLFTLSRVIKFNITSRPDSCEIYLDGKKIQITPSVISIPPGEHFIQLKKNGYSSSDIFPYNVSKKIYEYSKDPEDAKHFTLEKLPR